MFYIFGHYNTKIAGKITKYFSYIQIFPPFSMKICVFTRKIQFSGSLILFYQKDFVTLQADFVSP